MFTLGWTTYVIYLPKLAAQVGIAPSTVILILMLDQAIFTITDTAMGIAADRIAGVGRPARRDRRRADGDLLRGLCRAALCGRSRHGRAGLFIALIVIWAITSSALRAPPLTLLGKYAQRRASRSSSALVMLGYGLAGAVSPYLGVVLRDNDPRLPFIISSVVLLLTTLALTRVERDLAGDAAPAKPAAPPNRSARCRSSSSHRW